LLPLAEQKKKNNLWWSMVGANVILANYIFQRKVSFA
jgi:hypothetical protein